MACFAVIIVSGFISISAAKEACGLCAAVGQSLTLPHNKEGLANNHGLRWYHDSKTLFVREEGIVYVGKRGDISANGSLQLKNLQLSNAGLYDADVQLSNGNWITVRSGRLCVMDKVSKPHLTYVCDFKSSTVNLNCNVAGPQGLDFSWMLDGTYLTSKTRQTLSVSLSRLKEQGSFTCGVAKTVCTERSDTVRPTCTTPSSSPPDLLCFPSQTVVAAVAGGVSLILLLIVIVIVLCFYYRCNKNQKGLREKWAVRMLSLNKLEPDSINPDYETMRPTENPSPPSPKPSPRACYQNVPPPGAQTGNVPLQLSTVADRQPLSPVPKPRTKTTNIVMCLPQETFSEKE